MQNRVYLCIDLKSFYASVECVERGLDPMTTLLAVADPERTEKTICLAITPAMKALGIKNRCRVFQIPAGVEYIMAVPRMHLYMEYAASIYGIYLKYIAKEDIYVYSIDEAFMDVTDYLHMYQLTAKELGQKIMKDILDTTGITATCGIGTNLYLTKIALDITAKHVADHIGYLDEEAYQKTLWNYKPLTDFWRVGPGTAKKLANVGITTMGEIARADENLLYHMLGVDAELLIDHAWGREPVTIADIKNYKPKENSLNSGQVLPCDYNFEDGRLIVKEMADLLCLDLVDKGLVTDSITLHISYAKEVMAPAAHGSVTLPFTTNSVTKMMPYVMQIYDAHVNPNWPIRRVNITYGRLMDEAFEQYDIFTNPAEIERERKLQRATLAIKKKFGNDAILKGMNLDKAGTTKERTHQIGGHKSGQ